MLIGVDECDYLLLLLAVGEVGRVGQYLRVGFILKVQFTQVLQPVRRGDQLGELWSERVELRLGISQDWQFVTTGGLAPV